MTRPTVVLALGGSLLNEAIESDWTRAVRVLFTKTDARLAVVVGGGRAARSGIELARHGSDDDEALDWVGISATRLNAAVLRCWFGHREDMAVRDIPSTIEEAISELEAHGRCIMGGTHPGHTTDAVAVRLAAAVGAERCIIATNVSHVYSTDPRLDAEATSFDELTHDGLVEIVGIEHSPGTSSVVDPVAAGVARDHLLELCVLDGRHPERIEAALSGGTFEGTRIRTVT